MKSIPLYVQIIVCLVASMLLGVFAPEAAKDMLRTSVNVYGDTCVAVLVAKSEKESLTIDI